MSQITNNEEKSIPYPAMTVAEYYFIDDKLKEELRNRTLGLNAHPVIVPILASQNLNSQIAVSFRASLQRKLWSFLIPDGDAEEFLIKTQKEFTENPNDSASFAFFLNPYVQTGLFIGECINLDMALSNGFIKLTEKPGTHKDRYTSVSYANWVISFFDKDLLKEESESDDWTELLGVTMVA